MYDLVLFDMDGTLISSGEGILSSYMLTLEHFGVYDKTPEDLRFMLGPPIRDSFRTLGCFEESQIEDVVTKCREYFAENGMKGFYLFDGVVDMLEALKSKDIKMAVATSARTTSAKECLGHFDIAKYFEIIVGANQDGSRSEKPEIIAYILKSLSKGYNPIMIGDRKFDILGAKAHGMSSIGCLWGYGDEVELLEAGATYLVKSPNEVLDLILKA